MKHQSVLALNLFSLRPQICIWALLSVGLALSGMRANANEAYPPNYTVEKSIPIDKLIQKLYPDSPLNMNVLRQTLVNANPKVITGNPQQRVKGGTPLLVPDHGHVVSYVLTPYVPAPVADAQTPDPTASDPQVRRHWVRFP